MNKKDMHTLDPITCQCVPGCARCKLIASRSLPVPQSSKKPARIKYNVECPRCLGSGKFDRGVCFECKGTRLVKRLTKPNTAPRNIVVTFDNGKQDFVKMYFFTLEYALKAVEYQLIARGWTGTVAEVQS